jgi:hypothetical protein
MAKPTERPARPKRLRKDAEGAADRSRSPARAIARVLWTHDFDAANPTATVEQRKEGWAASRAHYMKLGKQVEKRLARQGFVIQPAPDKA